MTRFQSKIPFYDLTCYDEVPKLREVEKRLKTCLETMRQRAQDVEIKAARRVIPPKFRGV